MRTLRGRETLTLVEAAGEEGPVVDDAHAGRNGQTHFHLVGEGLKHSWEQILARASQLGSRGAPAVLEGELRLAPGSAAPVRGLRRRLVI